MESILTSIKKLFGIAEDDINFDPDIIIYINSALMFLTQIGIGPVIGFTISTKDQKWTDFIGDRIDIESIKTYVYLKVRMVFDPPTNSFVVDAIERQIKEIEWRLNS